MDALIKSKLQTVLEDWKAGRPVRTLMLGHSPRLFRQELALEYALHVIGVYLDLGKLDPAEHPMSAHPDFLFLCEGVDKGDLRKDEIDAAESLAWKALVLGWDHALTGFEDARYIYLTREVLA